MLIIQVPYQITIRLSLTPCLKPGACAADLVKQGHFPPPKRTIGRFESFPESILTSPLKPVHWIIGSYQLSDICKKVDKDCCPYMDKFVASGYLPFVRVL